MMETTDVKYVQLTNFFLVEEKNASLSKQIRRHEFVCKIKNQYDIELILKVTTDISNPSEILKIEILNKTEAKEKLFYLQDTPMSSLTEESIIKGLSNNGVEFLNYGEKE